MTTDSRPNEIQSPTRGGVLKGYAAHVWKSEPALVSDDALREALSSVFASVPLSAWPSWFPARRRAR